MKSDSTSGAADFSDGKTVDVVDIRAPGLDDEASPLQPRVRIREEHNISRRDIDPYALKVLYRLARNNHIAYLVGGGVRDLLLGRRPKDFDISTDARPEQIRALFRNCILIGRRFRLAHIRYGDKIIETSTFRRTPETSADPTDPEADLFQRDDNLFGSPQEDALRRDFTVNGLFYDIETFSIIDYVGGMEDLAERRIRCIGDPNIRFREDPVRMIRAVRFASRLDFTLDPDTLEAIRRHGEELGKASPPRLLEEITRLFAFSSGEKSVRLLHSTGLLGIILPEVDACLSGENGESERLWRRLRALDEGDTVLPDATPALIFATLLLDPLKRAMERDWPANEFPRLRFDKVHAFLEPLSLRLRFPRKLVDRMVHMYLAQCRFASAGGKRGSLSNFVTQDSFHESLALAEILHTAENLSQSRLNQWRDLLTERIYGRDDDERKRHGGSENGERQRSPAAEESDAPAGPKLTRSARRRRNRRLKKQRERGEAQTSAKPAGEEVKTDRSAEPEAARAAENAVAEPAAEEAAATPETKGEAKTEKSRNRRQRSKKKTAEPARTNSESTADVAPKAEILETVQPLTASAFYNPPPAPAEKKPGGRKTKAAAGEKEKKPEKKKARSAEKKPRTEEEPAKPGPLPMDRADEADIPMHWLDEI